MDFEVGSIEGLATSPNPTTEAFGKFAKGFGSEGVCVTFARRFTAAAKPRRYPARSFFGLESMLTSAVESSARKTAFTGHSNTIQTRPGTASVDRPQHRDNPSTELIMELWSRMSFLSGLVLAALPAVHPCHQAFTEFREAENHLPDDQPMPPDVLRRADRAFKALPPGDRDRVMNGWAVAPEYPSLQSAARPYTEETTVQRCAVVSVDKNHRSLFSEFSPGESNRPPVEVVICEGTSKADALAYLWEAFGMIDANWPAILAGEIVLHDRRTGETSRHEDERMMNKKSGQSAFDSLSPGQLERTEECELTAA